MQYSINTDIGNIIITESFGILQKLHISRNSTPCFAGTNIILMQLSEYLLGQRKIFEVSIAPSGTDFELLVWNELLKIKYGQLVSYRELAVKIGNSKAYRAVASACSKNPIPIVIPCHRVICSDGSLGGYKYGIDIKKKLLDIEYNSV